MAHHAYACTPYRETEPKHYAPEICDLPVVLAMTDATGLPVPEISPAPNCMVAYIVVANHADLDTVEAAGYPVLQEWEVEDVR